MRGSVVRTKRVTLLFSSFQSGGDARGASRLAEPRLEAERQTRHELQVVARLPVLELAAQALEARDVIARLETEADRAVRLVKVEPTAP